MTRCAFYPIAGRFHIFFLGNNGELTQKLDPLCFTYQHVDCLFTLFKYRFSGKIDVKSGQVFVIVQRAVYFNQRNRGEDRMTNKEKKRLLRKKYKKHILVSFQKKKSRQTSGSVFAKRIKQVKKTKYGQESIRIVDCFPDDYGTDSSKLVSFGIKSS